MNGDGAILITGGAGFIGTNVAERLLSNGRRVVILDNFSRRGADQNMQWLQQRYSQRLDVVAGDVRNRADLQRALDGISHVFHFAGQVAVTASLRDPRTDFEINAAGTLNLLEEMRARQRPPSIIYTSTNKVYGGLDDVVLHTVARRYEPVDEILAGQGISEDRPLEFRTPYGCSKGAAEQYVLDYGRSFGVPAVVFRMSCVYGPHQFGTEDQGWVAHFLMRAIQGRPVTVYGDGMQVRDILFVDDLINAFWLAWEKIAELSGQAFNIGGGVLQAVSLLELIDLIAVCTAQGPRTSFDRAREGDQRYYVSNCEKFQRATGWQAQVGPREGVHRLYHWLMNSWRPVHEESAVS